MSKGRQLFRERDVTRAVKGVTKAGREVAQVKIAPDGTIIVLAGKPADMTKDNGNPWDQVYEQKRHQA